MKKLLKKRLRQLLNPLNKKLGYSLLMPDNEKNLLENLFSILRQNQFNPLHIVDIGANHGSWTKTALGCFPDAYYTLFEPQYWLEIHVKQLIESNPKIRFHPFGVGKEKGCLKFTVSSRDDSSTFRLTEEEARLNGLKQIEVEVVTLNEFLPQLQLPVPDLIKIDAEGLDLDVLMGANDWFGKTEIFLVEAAVVANDIENDIFSVMRYMNDNGYRLFEITDLNRPFPSNVLWLVELVFIRKNGYLDSRNFR